MKKQPEAWAALLGGLIVAACCLKPTKPHYLPSQTTRSAHHRQQPQPTKTSRLKVQRSNRMGVTADSTASIAFAGSVTPTVAHALGGGSNRIVVASVETNGGNSSGVTYNGVAMTLSTRASGATSERVELWYIKEADLPGAGTYNVIASIPGGSRGVLGVRSYSMVDQTTPLGTGVTDHQTNTSPTVTVSSGVGNMVFAGMEWDGSETLSSPSGSQLWSVQDVGFHGLTTSGGGQEVSGASSVNASWTLSSSQQWTMAAVEIKAASGGGGGGGSNGNMLMFFSEPWKDRRNGLLLPERLKQAPIWLRPAPKPPGLWLPPH